MQSSLIIDSLSDNSNIGYTPMQIMNAYGLGNRRTGAGITVGVIDFIGNPYIQRNLNIFSEEFGLRETEIEFYGDIENQSNFEFAAYIEPSVDVQWVHAIASDANLKIIRAPEYTVQGAIDAIKTAVEIGCNIVLQTFQAPFIEDYLEYSDIFKNDAVFIASAGDYGAGAFFPSCYPYCISVGGTSLEIDSAGNRVGIESVWTGTGGGICNYFQIPEYQSKFESINELTGGKRGVPDISFLADPEKGYSVYHSSVRDSFGWYKAGGTSISAAVTAGIIANILSYDNTINKNNMVEYLYSAAGDGVYTNRFNIFYDVTEGNNGLHMALKGYDLCTGLGSLINI